jgi:AAA domain/Bifunctional DNA primase/polymerase, N-terminal
MNAITDQRLALYRNDYAPLPINGKIPPIEGWSKLAANSDTITLWETMYAGAESTGILTRTTPALDLDLLDADAGDTVSALFCDHFGGRGKVLMRFGRAPKRAILFRTSTPFKKITVNLIAANGDATQKIEVLAEGQQVVVAGVHVDTRKPYYWIGGEPWTVPRTELPEISEAEMRAFVELAVNVLVEEYGYRLAKPERKIKGAGEGHDWQEPIGDILVGSNLHDSIAILAAKLVCTGIEEAAAIEIIRALMENSRAPVDARFVSRLNDIGRAVRSARDKFTPAADKTPATELIWSSDAARVATAPAALVAGLLPEVGVALLSGQWGVYKTFCALDLAAVVMSGQQFIDAPVVRCGGVLFLAAEGAQQIPLRLRAVLDAKHPDAGRVPFVFAESCPRLLDGDVVAQLLALARQAHERMLTEYGVPLVLIMIDTFGAAAGYVRDGQENDAALNQTIMNRLGTVAREAKLLVLAIDHFGKTIDVGTRGSSAKEGAADTVLALLGDRAVTGAVSNTRLAVRKTRSGPSGAEYSFAVRVVEVGDDETSLVIDWRPGQPVMPTSSDGGWSKSLRLLRAVLMDQLATGAASEQRPWADGPIVRAADLELVRGEFFKRYPADGDDRAKAATRRMAFNRAIRRAQDQGLVGVRELGGVTYVWLAGHDRNA